MRYKEFFPGNRLKPYIQCYFTCETDTPAIVEDKVFATGFVEILFNLGNDGPQRIGNGAQATAPAVQFWGQTIQPLTFKTTGKHNMLGVRFFTHTAACFFNEPIETFNGQVVDFNDITGKTGRLLHAQLQDAHNLSKKIELVDAFLLKRLLRFGLKFQKLDMMNSIMQQLTHDSFFENIESVAARYGLSSRYLQKIFIAYCGLSPNFFSKINRFQKSLQLVAKSELPLTTIAYKCGYYDQSHFIKDFKYFTGIAPSHFQPGSSTDFTALLTV